MSAPLTREQVEDTCDVIGEVSIDWPVRISVSRSIRDHDAALRQQLAQVTGERDAFEIRIDSWRKECADVRQQLAEVTQEREQFRGLFGEYDEPPRTFEQAEAMWNTLIQQLRAEEQASFALTISRDEAWAEIKQVRQQREADADYWLESFRRVNLKLDEVLDTIANLPEDVRDVAKLELWAKEFRRNHPKEAQP